MAIYKNIKPLIVINNEPINEVSPMEIDNQVLYNRYKVEEEEIKEKIDSVIDVLKLQLTKNEYELDFQLLYSKCYEICLHWKANELYKEIEKQRDFPEKDQWYFGDPCGNCFHHVICGHGADDGVKSGDA